MSEGPTGRPVSPAVAKASVRSLLGLAALGFVLLRLGCAAIPLDRDEGAYALVAQRILAGDIPYRDIFDHKPPLVYLAYLLPVGLFGTSVVAIHATLYIATALATLFLFLCTRKLFGPLAAACAALIFTVLTIEPAWLATAANTEQFMLVPLLASLWCLLRADESPWALASAGALAAVACWVKPVAATDVLFLTGFAVVRFWRRVPRPPTGRLVRDAALAAAGAAAVSGVVLGVLAVRGALSGFADAVLAYNLDYVSKVPFRTGLKTLQSSLTAQAGAMWAIWAAAATVICDWRRQSRGAAVGLICALASAAAGIAIGSHFYPHYFLQAAPVLAAAAGLAISHAIVAARRAFGGRLAAIAALLIPAVVLAPGVLHDADFFFRSSPDQKVRALYGDNPFDASASIASQLDLLVRPSETVLIYGSEPQILFLAKRRSATRYIEFYPLTLSGATAERRQREAWNDIVASPPRAVLMTEVGSSLLKDAASQSFLRKHIARLLDTEFTLEGFRVFDGGPGRMVFGSEARMLTAQSDRSSRAPHMDLFLFARTTPSSP